MIPQIRDWWYRTALEGAPRSAAAEILHLASMPAWVLPTLRRSWARAGFRAGVPTISIGNLSVGGTGKTPFAAFLLSRVARTDYPVGLLTRGYGRGCDPASDDEAFAAHLEGVTRWVDPDRVRGAHRATAVGARALVLDDGFQHLRLARDLDIVLVDISRPRTSFRPFPGGDLREPPSALRRADLVVATRTDETDPEERTAWWRLLEVHAGRPLPRLLARHEVVGWTRPAGGRLDPPGAARDRTVLGFCGIGNPSSFRRKLAHTGAAVSDVLSFPDHHKYRPDDLDLIRRRSVETRADWLVTTRKDAARGGLDALPDLRVLEVRLVLDPGEEELAARIRRLGLPWRTSS